MPTSFEETLSFLYSQLPMFQRVGSSAVKKGLDNTIALCASLGNPQDKFKSIHIAGTNGKGSSSHMLAAILQSAGYKTGLYTSPHLKQFTERVRINGQEMPQEEVVIFVEKIKPTIEQIKPSFFEITVAMAFYWFAQQKVDIAVIETGLGGRLDSTNIIQPEISLITNIGLDHTDMLGETHAEIAGEKGGIIKPNTPIVISEKHPDTIPVFEKIAKERQATLTFAEDLITLNDQPPFSIEIDGQNWFKELSLSLGGKWQKNNLRGVLTVIYQLINQGYAIDNKAIQQGCESVQTLTGLKGRWQQIGSQPKVICDVGHNKEGIALIVERIKEEQYNKLWLVWGMVKDKNPAKIFDLLPKEATYALCCPDTPRGMPVETLHQTAQEKGFNATAHTSVMEALTYVLEKAAPEDLVFVGGSTFVVAELPI